MILLILGLVTIYCYITVVYFVFHLGTLQIAGIEIYLAICMQVAYLIMQIGNNQINATSLINFLSEAIQRIPILEMLTFQPSVSEPKSVWCHPTVSLCGTQCSYFHDSPIDLFT